MNSSRKDAKLQFLKRGFIAHIIPVLAIINQNSKPYRQKAFAIV